MANFQTSSPLTALRQYSFESCEPNRTLSFQKLAPLSISDSAARILGYDPGWGVGRDIMEFCHPEDVSRAGNVGLGA